MITPALLIGFAVGVVLTALAAFVGARRSIRRFRAAEPRARAAERMAEIGSMTGGLAHEIKNPLSTIGLNAQLLVEGLQDLGAPEDEKTRLINRTRALQRETERLRGILQDFLEFAGKVHLDRRAADVNALVSELVDFYTPEAERLGVRLRSDAAPEPLTATIDSRLVKQAILNLMINATQAMTQQSAAGSEPSPKPRELILRTRPARDAEGRRVVRVHVIDTGPGIDTETLARIFNPYFTTKAGGSGLGLPTARRLIEEHGGTITVDSLVGQGSDFCVSLPVEASPAS